MTHGERRLPQSGRFPGDRPAWDWRALALIALATICARGLLIGNPLIHIDEQFYLLMGQRMLDGAVPYVDLWDRKPIGLFLIYALAASLGGDGFVGYQVLASLFCAATAVVIRHMALAVGLDRTSALVAAVAYPFLIACFEGGGGQAPVFYNLLMAAAGWMVLLAARAARPLRHGAVAMLLVGLALQVKYTVLFEGLFFGLVLLALQWRRAPRLSALVAVAPVWIALALAPSLAAMLAYAAAGHFDAFWYANVASSLERGERVDDGQGWGQPGMLLLALAPLLALAAAEWRGAARPGAAPGSMPGSRIVRLWLAVALLAMVPMMSFWPHYALPALVPAALVLGMAHARGGARRWAARGLVALTAIAAVALSVTTNLRSGGRETAYGMAAIMARSPNCPFVFDGPVAGYIIARSCLPTRHAFPNHLRLREERGAIGVDQLGELARILGRRPGVIVTRSDPKTIDVPEAHRLVARALARDYRLAGRFPYKGRELLVYVLKDGVPALENCVSACRQLTPSKTSAAIA